MSTDTPMGELVVRTFAMPKDTNGNGDIFGGWLISQMDIGAAILAMKISKKRVATVAVDKMVFIKPVQVGEIVCCYASLVKIGRTSLTTQIQAWTIDAYSSTQRRVAEGTFTLVALNEQRMPTPVVDNDDIPS